MKNEIIMKVLGKRVILNVQHSKLGYGYPRLFIEVSEAKYINVDLTIGGAFRMEKKDFEDWASEAEEVTGDMIQKTIEENGMKYDKFVAMMELMK